MLAGGTVGISAGMWNMPKSSSDFLQCLLANAEIMGLFENTRRQLRSVAAPVHLQVARTPCAQQGCRAAGKWNWTLPISTYLPLFHAKSLHSLLFATELRTCLNIRAIFLTSMKTSDIPTSSVMCTVVPSRLGVREKKNLNKRQRLFFYLLCL